VPDFPTLDLKMLPVLYSGSGEAIGSELAAYNATAPASAAWPAANRVIGIPFTLTEPVTVTKLAAYNGATASGNTDLGIFDANFVKLVSIGDTAQAGTNALQEFNITDTLLCPGRYYFAMKNSSATSTFFRWSTPPVNALKLMGVWQNTGAAGSLAASYTPAVPASAYVPLVGMCIAPRTLLA